MTLRGNNADDLHGDDERPPRRRLARLSGHLPHRVFVAGIGCMTGILVAWTLATAVLLYRIEHRPWLACAILAFVLVFWEMWLAVWIIGRDER